MFNLKKLSLAEILFAFISICILVILTYLLIDSSRTNREKSSFEDKIEENILHNEEEFINTQKTINKELITQGNDKIKRKPLEHKEKIVSSRKISNMKINEQRNINEEEEYYEKTIATLENIDYLDTDSEVYQKDDNIYINLDGERVKITSDDLLNNTKMKKGTLKREGKYYMASLSNDKRFVSFHEIQEGIFIKDLETGDIIKVGNGNGVVWHPNKDLLVYEVDKDGEYNVEESDIVLFDVKSKKHFQITDTSGILESNPVFSENGNYVYCKDIKSGRIIKIDIAKVIKKYNLGSTF